MGDDGKTFVTGATGFIGTILVTKLLERGEKVRALSRCDPSAPPGSRDGRPWTDPNVEIVRGDITDRASLDRAMKGCRRVYHLAAYAKNWSPNPQTFYEMNVEGMRNVFDVAAAHRIERVVWTSTCVTFGPSQRDGFVDEATPRLTDHYYTEYEETKTIAEREAMARAASGFPVVIVNPTRVYGPGHLTEGNAVARLIDDYDRGKVPFLLNFGRNVGNWVFVDDVAEGHILAMQRGRIGHRYLLGGENASLKAFFRTVDAVSGKRHIQIPLKTVLPLLFAWFQKQRAYRTGVYPRITPGWVRTFARDWAVCCDKATRELGYTPTPLREGVRLTYAWLEQLRREQVNG
jgi:farnesol dehydrogenase